MSCGFHFLFAFVLNFNIFCSAKLKLPKFGNKIARENQKRDQNFQQNRLLIGINKNLTYLKVFKRHWLGNCLA